MIINTNVSSLTAQEAATNTGKSISSSLEKLSTGLKINKASDDASGLAIADKLRTQATSIDQGVANGNSAVTLLQIADKSMSEQSNILDTVKAKLIQANTDTTSADGRESIRKDIVKLLEQLDNIAEQTNYNGNVLLQQSATDTGSSAKLSFQIGETKNDIIGNSSIQSNTVGLGSATVYSADNGNNTLDSTESVTLASSGAITLNAETASGIPALESVSLSGDVDNLTLTVGMTVTNTDATNTDFTALLEAAKTAGTFTESGGVYTVATAGTLDLSSVDDVSATVTTPAETGASTTFSSTVGDIIATTNGNVNTDSALSTMLNDTTKFEDIGDGNYKALTAETVTVSAGESVSHLDATTVDIGQGSAYPAGSTITLNEDVIAGSDLANQLNNVAGAGQAKFELNSGTAGEKGAVYTVLADFTTDNLKIVDGESITLVKGAPVTLDDADFSAVAMVSAITLSGTSVQWDSSGTTPTDNLIASTGTPGDGDDALNVAGAKELKFTITASADTQTFAAKAGDTVSNLSETTTVGSGMSESIIESSNWIDNGDGSYTAIADATISFDDSSDSLDVTRVVGSTETPKVAGGPDADTGLETAAAAEKKAVAPDAVSLSFTTDTKVDVTNNGSTANILTMSTDGTNTLSNGESNLNAISALGAGEFTQALADSFQSIVDDAITNLNGFRGDIGSTQNQVESAVRNLMTQSTNVKAAESIIRDVDYAQESANFNKQNIISQAGSYAISQANSVQQNVLKLLQ